MRGLQMPILPNFDKIEAGCDDRPIESDEAADGFAACRREEGQYDV